MYVGEISPRIVSVRSNTKETSGSSLVQFQNDAFMVPNPRENSRGGRISRETSGRLAYAGEISPRIASVRSNTGETSGRRFATAPNRDLDGNEPEGKLTGGRISRETSRSLAYVGEISTRIASVRLNTGETSGKSSLQRQRETSMATNSRENSRGACSSRKKYVGETSPTLIEIPAEMVECLYMQEILHSFPGLVPSEPPDELVRKPLCQEDAMLPFRTQDEPPKTVKDFKGELNLGRHKVFIS